MCRHCPSKDLVIFRENKQVTELHTGSHSPHVDNIHTCTYTPSMAPPTMENLHLLPYIYGSYSWHLAGRTSIIHKNNNDPFRAGGGVLGRRGWLSPFLLNALKQKIPCWHPLWLSMCARKHSFLQSEFQCPSFPALLGGGWWAESRHKNFFLPGYVFYTHPRPWERKHGTEGRAAGRKAAAPNVCLRGKAGYLDDLKLSKEKLYKEAVQWGPKSVMTERSRSFEGKAAVWCAMATCGNQIQCEFRELTSNSIQIKEPGEKNKYLGVWLSHWFLLSSVIVSLKMFPTKRKWEIHLRFDLH